MKILVADDDSTSLLLLKDVLTDWGYEVSTVRDGTKAWEILQQDNAPQLIILDWIMPGLDGPEICRRVRAASHMPYIYIILLTAKTEMLDIVHGMEAGADDYLTKPFAEQELHVRLRAGKRVLELEEALRRQATRDALTGVWNRRAIFEKLQQEFERQTRVGGSLGLALADVDYFKRINDTYGHQSGDAVLCETARRLETSLRTYDVLGRYGGEEFLIVMPGIDIATIRPVAERLRVAVNQEPIMLTASPISISISLGATVLKPDKNTDVETLIRRADTALYTAKNGGRNRVEVSF